MILERHCSLTLNSKYGTVNSAIDMEDLRRRSRTEDDPSCVTPDGGEPTEAEILELRHVSDRIPVTSWLVAAISLTERFTYYGINAPFRKFASSERQAPILRTLA